MVSAFPRSVASFYQQLKISHMKPMKMIAGVKLHPECIAFWTLLNNILHVTTTFLLLCSASHSMLSEIIGTSKLCPFEV